MSEDLEPGALRPGVPKDRADDGLRSPRDEYVARSAASHAERGALLRREARLANARLAVAAVAIALAWFSFGTRDLPAAWLSFPAGAFALLALIHDRVIQRRERADARIAFYGFGLARIDEEWRGNGNPGASLAPAKHLYADDLDLFGQGSLFEKLCTARTPAGEATLARWLTVPSALAEASGRQQAVRELTPRLDLRERLSAAGERAALRMVPERLRRWGAGEIALRGRGVPVAAACLSTATTASLLGWIFAGTGFAPVLLAVVLQSGLAAWVRARVGPVLKGLDAPTRDLALFARVLAVVEQESFEAPALRRLREGLDTHGLAPSEAVARLRRLSDLLDGRRNQLFAPIAGLLLWGTQLAWAVEAWRQEHGAALGAWIDSVGDFEALCSIAGYAYENPQDPFAEFSSEGPLFDGRGLGHPLLPRDRSVTNDLELGRTRRAFIMSGSNMSGKSTMLRTVGTNAVLAMLGAPVRAESLRLSPLRIGASLQVRDSLQDGVSHFYAELVRLRRIVELTEQPVEDSDVPAGVLFLLDEILHGTNSHDRRIGADAVIRGLVDRGAIGIATTHDLALAEIAGDAQEIENVHFADRIDDGEMHFDYRLAPGVVRNSNALALMRAVGLKV